MDHDHHAQGRFGMARAFGQPRGVAGLLGGLLMSRLGRTANATVVEAAQLSGDERVLDMGCGPGTGVGGAVRRLRSGGTVTGIDPSPEMLALATWRNRDAVRVGRAVLRHGTATAIPAHDSAFDVVWAVNSAHHWDDPDAALVEFARVTAVGGRLLLGEALRTGGQARFGPPGLDDAEVVELESAVRAAGFAGVRQSRHGLAGPHPLVIVRGRR